MQKLILLHGALGCAADLKPLQQALGNDFDACPITFSGHGDKAAQSEISLDQCLQDLSAAVTAPAHIFGYSMGGYVALSFAARFPERVARVFTLGTKLDWTPEGAAQEAARLQPEKIAEKVPKFAALLAERHGSAHWPEVVRQTAALLLDLGAAPRLDGAAMRQIQAEVVIGRGERDNMVGEQECLDAVAAMPRARYLQLPGQPHPLEACSPAVVAEAVRRFFMT